MAGKEQRIKALRNAGTTKKWVKLSVSRSDEVATNSENSGLAAPGSDWHPPLQAEPYAWEAEALELEQQYKPQIAAYIAWAASPAKGRLPATQAELASLLGLKSDRTIRQWREKDKSIEAEIKTRQSGPLWGHRRDIFEALAASASTADAANHSDRKLALEMLGDYVPKSRQDVANVTPATPFTSDEYSAAAQQLALWESAIDSGAVDSGAVEACASVEAAGAVGQ